MNLKHNQPSRQGMTITRAELVLGESYAVELTTLEEGFDDPTTWRVPVTYQAIQWKPAHFWLREVIDWDLEKRILYLVGIYDDKQLF